MKCRCGHSRGVHFATLNARRKRARRGDRPGQAQLGCRFMASSGRKVCPCRAFKEAERPYVGA